jgi:hypothetical protein
MADPPDVAGPLAAWSERARPTIALLTELANGLEGSYRRGDLPVALESAELFLSEVNRGMAWRLADECPHAEAGAELRAGIGVVRNGALLVRRIVKGQPGRADEPTSGLSTSCAALLEQGRAHLAHVAVLASIS